MRDDNGGRSLDRRSLALIRRIRMVTITFREKKCATLRSRTPNKMFDDVNLDRNGSITKVKLSAFGTYHNLGPIVKNKESVTPP
jgi:hypothetical protein